MSDLEKRLKPLVDVIKSGKKKVTFFQGAGVSTSAGIPDFRSPETGLYSNLARLNLPYAEAVFDIDYFRENPKAFYVLADELSPGKFTPTKFHYLIKIFQDKQLLRKVYTQNIDTLERVAGIDEGYIVEAHGSFARNYCIDCSEEMSIEELKKHMSNKHKNDGVPICPKCSGYVKPDIVFFGEGLPKRFFDSWEEDADEVEIAIVAGTSLTVYPFSSLPSEVGTHALRVLINNEIVGDFKHGRRKTDILALEECDVVAEVLSRLLGWEEELNELISKSEMVFGGKVEVSKESVSDTVHKLAEDIKIAEEKANVNIDEQTKESKTEDQFDELDKEISKLKI